MSKYKPKARDYDVDDCMAINAKTWNETPTAVEQAYRRGFAQGFAAACAAIERGHMLFELEEHHTCKLVPWRHEDPMKPSYPPVLGMEQVAREREVE